MSLAAYILIVILFGKEYRGATFENAPLAITPNAGKIDPEDVEKVPTHAQPIGRTDSDSDASNKGGEEDDVKAHAALPVY